MSHTLNASQQEYFVSEQDSLLKRTGVLAYGLTAYLIGCTGLFWLILSIGGLAPSGIGVLENTSMPVAILINIGLVSLFGIQHSVMARDRFKKWITQFIPEATERSTFMLMSGLVTMVMIYYWQPVAGTAWVVEETVTKYILWSAYTIGWSYLLLSTFITNHFELMGLRQVYMYFKQVTYKPLPFTRKYMYRYSRHPMMLGVLIGMWAIPVMSISHLVLATLLTTYMAIGLILEERSLLNKFGETYRVYKKEIATFIPKIF